MSVLHPVRNGTVQVETVRHIYEKCMLITCYYCDVSEWPADIACVSAADSGVGRIQHLVLSSVGYLWENTRPRMDKDWIR